MKPSRPPVAQILYDLGVKPDEALYTESGPLPPTVASDAQLPGTIEKNLIPWPPLPPMTSPLSDHWPVPAACTITPLPLCITESPPHTRNTIAASVAQVQSTTPIQRILQKRCSSTIVQDYDLTWDVMATIYMSPDPYHNAFKQPLDLGKFSLSKHPTAHLTLHETSDRVYLASMRHGSPAAKIPN